MMKINMRKYLLLSVSLCVWAIVSGICIAEVNVNIGVFAPPPPLVIESPPPMAVVYGTPYVYYAPDISVGLFFYAGNWYRPHQGRWFRARSYRGPWAQIHHGSVPPVLVKLPPDYRHVPPGHKKIPYGHMKKNWKSWERDRHWDGRAGGPSGHRAGYGKKEHRAKSGNSHKNGNGNGRQKH
jgi:hypothetical protein